MRKPQNNLVTKDYLDQKLQDFGGKLKNELSEIKDEIMGEIKAMREEFDIHQTYHARINDTLGDHEKRLSTLETTKL